MCTAWVIRSTNGTGSSVLFAQADGLLGPGDTQSSARGSRDFTSWRDLSDQARLTAHGPFQGARSAVSDVGASTDFHAAQRYTEVLALDPNVLNKFKF